MARTRTDTDQGTTRPARPKGTKAGAEAAVAPGQSTGVQSTGAQSTVTQSTEATSNGAESTAGTLKLKDLIAGVAGATGGSKPEVKAAVTATLAAMGEALAGGKSLSLPPLGKLRVVKTKGPALTLKLRLAEGAKAEGLALADDGEDG